MADLTKLVRYSQEKLEKLRQIEKVTEQQKIAIDSQDIAALNSLVEEKQKVIDYIDWCDNSFQDEMKRLKDRFGVKALNDIGKIDDEQEGKTLVDIITKITETIESIQAMEKDNHRKLVESMDQIKEKLRKVRNGQKSVALYDSGNEAASGSFIDKKK